MIRYSPKLNFNKPKSIYSNYKHINVGFILINHDKMTIKQMADELGCSQSKVQKTIKEYKIPYTKKYINEAK